MDTSFSDEELLRYSRQIMLPEFDFAGQLALKRSRVLIVGCGGLGCPVALYLASAGVGHIELADHDVVDLSNLQRQIAHDESNIGMPKVASVCESIQRLNSHIQVTTHQEALEIHRLKHLVQEVDLVLDCTDNFQVRFAINEACLEARKPLVSGAAIRFEGQISVFDFRDPQSPCYQCLYPDLAEEQLSCSESGVLAPLVGVIGGMQALEAIKLLAGVGRPLTGRVLLFDANYMEWRGLGLKRDPACPACGYSVDVENIGGHSSRC